jgi:hypothetical protein
MKRISFNPRFVNEAGNDLISGKIHTIRQNYEYWKKFEGKDVALFTWEGKPRRKDSKQKVFCVKRIVSVQEAEFREKNGCYGFFVDGLLMGDGRIAKNDGFKTSRDLHEWFNYKSAKMAILHFTDFRY